MNKRVMDVAAPRNGKGEKPSGNTNKRHKTSVIQNALKDQAVKPVAVAPGAKVVQPKSFTMEMPTSKHTMFKVTPDGDLMTREASANNTLFGMNILHQVQFSPQTLRVLLNQARKLKHTLVNVFVGMDTRRKGVAESEKAGMSDAEWQMALKTRGFVTGNPSQVSFLTIKMPMIYTTLLGEYIPPAGATEKDFDPSTLPDITYATLKTDELVDALDVASTVESSSFPRFCFLGKGKSSTHFTIYTPSNVFKGSPPAVLIGLSKCSILSPTTLHRQKFPQGVKVSLSTKGLLKYFKYTSNALKLNADQDCVNMEFQVHAVKPEHLLESLRDTMTVIRFTTTFMYSNARDASRAVFEDWLVCRVKESTEGDDSPSIAMLSTADSSTTRLFTEKDMMFLTRFKGKRSEIKSVLTLCNTDPFCMINPSVCMQFNKCEPKEQSKVTIRVDVPDSTSVTIVVDTRGLDDDDDQDEGAEKDKSDTVA